MTDDAIRLNRRQALALLTAGSASLAAAPLPQAGPPAGAAVVQRNDEAVASLLTRQIVAGEPRWIGSVPDEYGLHGAGGASGLIEAMTASFVHADSRFHHDPVLAERIRLAAGFLERVQSPDGNIDLLTTNFNSPPDTGFVVHGVATAARIARVQGDETITTVLLPFLTKAGAGMAAGGVHTPNHRWVISSALAQINELAPDPRLVRRIDEWLAEGIDIDEDGQFTERSTLTYNVVTTRALVVMAAKLKRPALLEPVRRNLRTLTYLLHADGEVVTEISRRQDQFTRGGVDGYWFPATYLAVVDAEGRFAALAHQAAGGARLSALLEYPELSRPLPASAPLPDDFARVFPAIRIARIRRGPLSATIVLDGSSRFLSLRSGDVVIEGLRFATSFFGKGQFVPDTGTQSGDRHVLTQHLEAPYYQPLRRPVTTDTWATTRAERRQSEIARLEQSAEIAERPNGLRVRLRASGTAGVPLAVEIAFREGGTLEGGTALRGMNGAFLLERGTGRYRSGGTTVTFGPGAAEHRYVQLRGAEPRLPGLTAYLTGHTPFDQTIDIAFS